MTRTGLWQEVTQRFTERTGHRAEVVVSGPKNIIAPAMAEGRVDLLTMHASDTVINLVADGFAVDPQPWARNDLVLVGPADDPAGIRGMNDGAAAMKRIVEARSPFLVHRSIGAMDTMQELLDAAGVELDPDVTHTPANNPHNRVVALAAEHGAYTLVGRIPFRDGKMDRAGMELMVQGDPRMRRPYVVVVANPRRWPGARYEAARALADFLREPETQNWLADFGRGKLDDRPLFFPVDVR